jgi:peptidoglycan-N-acetylglucosamine deacetylase
MNKTASILSIIILLSLNSLHSQSVAPGYQVGTWQGFRTAAISFTFDDNCLNQLALAVPMFKTHGFNLTLFTVTSWSPNWTGLQNAASDGNEVASHTVTHTSLGGLTDAQQIT